MRKIISKEALINRLKERYKYIFVLFFVCIFCGIITKNITYIYGEKYMVYVYGAKDDLSKMYLDNNTVIQELTIDYKNIKEIELVVGNNSDINSKYKISIKDDNNNEVISKTIGSNDIGKDKEDKVDISLYHGINANKLFLEIEPIDNNSKEGMYVYTKNVDDTTLVINNDCSSKEIILTKGYENVFTNKYILILSFIFILGIINILIFDMKRIYDFVFSVCLSIGIIIVMINPILDTPDDQAHICRAEFTSRGILFISGSNSNYNVSESVQKILNNDFRILENSTVYHDKMDYNYTGSYRNYAGSNSFFGYIPQALGIIIAKILGKLFGASSIFILLLGRLSNLIAYSFIVRYGVKKAPIFKIPLAIASISPMALFIASSFNPDALTYSLVLLCISYCLYIYKKEQIDIKDMIIFAVLSICIGILKAPYSLIGGLILFYKKEKFINKKMYYIRYIVVGIIALICALWVLFTLSNSGDSSAFGTFYSDNNVDVKKQIHYILNNKRFFITDFCNSSLNNLPKYLEQLNLFGWLSYGVNKGINILYIIFIGNVIILFPNKEIISKRIKIGVIFISVGIYLGTCLVMYLTWTTVGSSNIEGIQGRYFVPLISILPLLSNGKCIDNLYRQKVENRFIMTALLFTVVFAITILAKYY